VKLRLTIAYDGRGFHGFARNAEVLTVQGSLEAALSRVLQCDAEVVGAGRTDAGVHAWGQVVSLAAPDGADPDQVQHALNAMLGPEIVVREATLVSDDFDARHSAAWRLYRYTVLNRPVPDPFLAATSWWVPRPLDLPALRLACDPFIGEHDFSSFCRRPDPLPDGEPRSLVRRVLGAGWQDEGRDVLRFEIQATSFCHQMVRSIVGTMVDVGLGKRRAGDLRSVLRATDRAAAGTVAPPHGLCLWEVGY
jgi:tRNA pseudouridine38-40 synthase